MGLPYLLFADSQGKIYSHPYLRMSGSLLDKCCVPKEEEIIRAPSGTTFFYLPGTYPFGFNPDAKKFEELKTFKGKRAYAVAAFLPPSYLRLYNPSAKKKNKQKQLPLWAYTACGFYGGSFVAAAKKIDRRTRQAPVFYNNSLIEQSARAFLKSYPENRIYAHLFNCALNYNCLAAKNLFLKRWEAPLPVARFCNARCIGCLSYQDSKCIASHQRIGFCPTVSEVVEVMLNHLSQAKEAVVSFGQGCEGEPILEADLIAESVKQVRRKTKRGTININTNASFPEKIEQLARAGVDSFRVSLNSPRKKLYDIYFQPEGYGFSDVLKSIKIAKKRGKFVSLNLFIFPGFNDSTLEIKKLICFLKKNPLDMIQWRNLNIDPFYFTEKMAAYGQHPTGVLNLIKKVKKEFPGIKTGYFNLPKERF